SAYDVPLHEDEYHDYGDDSDDGEGGKVAPFGAVLAHEVENTRGYRAHRLILEEGHAVGEVAPPVKEGENCADDHARRCDGQEDQEKGREPVAAVDAGRVLELPGYGSEIADEDQHRERYADRRIREYGGELRVEEVDVLEDDEHRREEDGYGKHLRHQEAQNYQALPLEAESRDPVGRGYREDQGYEHDGARDDETVLERTEHVEVAVLQLR